MKTTKAVRTDRSRARRASGRNLLIPLGVGLGLLTLAGNVNGEGFRNPPPGTFNLGRAGGRIAHVDDSSAVHQNPANLVGLTSLEFQLTPTVVNIACDFDSPIGQSATTKDPWKLLPNFFVATPLQDGQFALGLGVTAPYGLGSTWDEDSDAFNSPMSLLRYQSPHYTELKTLNFNPTVAARLGNRVWFGAGFDVMWSEISLKQYYPWLIYPGSVGLEPDGRMKATGDGLGYGGNVGLTWLITDRQRLAVSYRSAMNVDYDGDFTVNNITATAAYVGVQPRTDFSSKLQFPNIVAVGYGIQVSDSVRLETDFEWVQFSRFKSLAFDAGGNGALMNLPPAVRQNWEDTFTAGLGGDWRINDAWVLRFGYQFYKSPVPDSTFSPTIPDADQNVITIGVGWKHNGHSVEAAYGADFYNERRITDNQNPALNGDYQITVHLMSFAYRYTF